MLLQGGFVEGNPVFLTDFTELIRLRVHTLIESGHVQSNKLAALFSRFALKQR